MVVVSPGDSGLDGTDLLPKSTVSPVTDKNPILAMRDALMAQPKGTAWVVATGGLTNVALLFATFPEVTEHVQGLTIMGGAVGDQFTDAVMSQLPGEERRIGNVTPYAEFNVYVDPEASGSLFNNPILASKTMIASLDLTHTVLASKDVQTRILYGSKADLSTESTVLRKILHGLLTFFGTTYEGVFGLAAGPPLHDPLAVAMVLSNMNPEYARKYPDKALRFDDRSGERFHINVITDGQHGKDVSITGQLGRIGITPAPHLGGAAIPRAVDVDAFWNLVLECIQLADDWNAVRREAQIHA